MARNRNVNFKFRWATSPRGCVWGIAYTAVGMPVTEAVGYLGRRYMLKVIPSEGAAESVRLKGNRLEVITKSTDPDDIRARIRAWYRVKGRDYTARRQADSWFAKIPYRAATPFTVAPGSSVNSTT